MLEHVEEVFLFNLFLVLFLLGRDKLVNFSLQRVHLSLGSHVLVIKNEIAPSRVRSLADLLLFVLQLLCVVVSFSL